MFINELNQMQARLDVNHLSVRDSFSFFFSLGFRFLFCFIEELS